MHEYLAKSFPLCLLGIASIILNASRPIMFNKIIIATGITSIARLGPI